MKKAPNAGLLVVAVLLPATAQARRQPHLGFGQQIARGHVHNGNGWLT